MSMIYYNLSKNSNFLPILEYMKDGKIGSFVSDIDNNLEIDGHNWSNLATTYSIKQYVDNKVLELKKSENLFEDYYSVSDSILQPESGTIISGNITNIFYPDNNKIRFNTENDIKFYTDDLNIVIPKDTVKLFDGFVYRNNVPVYNVLKNSNLDYPLTWNNIDYNKINNSKIKLDAGQTVEYKLRNIDNETIEYHITTNFEHSINSSLENDVLRLENISDNLIEISDMMVNDTNILREIDTSLNADVYNGRVNCHWALYNISSYETTRVVNVSNLKLIGTAQYLLDEINNIQYIRVSPYSGIHIDKSLVHISSYNFNLFLQIKIDSKNATIVKKQHLFSYAGLKFELKGRESDPNHFDLYFTYPDSEEPILLRDNLLLYDINLDFQLSFESNRLYLYVNNFNLIPSYLIYIITPTNDYNLEIGKLEDEIGFYGNVNLKRNERRLLKITGTNTDDDYYWLWNESDKIVETKKIDVEYDTDFMVNGFIETPVFDPYKSNWSFDLELQIDNSNVNLPKYFEILSCGSSKYNGLNIRYNKLSNKLEIALNDNKSCDYNTGWVNTETLSQHRIERLVDIPTNGLLHIKFEYVCGQYNIYCDEFGRRKIAELISSDILEATSFRLCSCDGINIETRKTNINLEGKTWWNFNTLERSLDYTYCNLDCSNGLTIDSDGFTNNNPSNILRIPFAYRSDSKALITLKLLGYDENYNNIITNSEGNFRIYQRSANYISVEWVASTIYGLTSRTIELNSKYNFNKKYHFEIISENNRYIIQTYDEDFNILETKDFDNSCIIEDLVLLRNSDASTSYVSYNMLETFSNNFYWNCVDNGSFELKKGVKLYILNKIRDNGSFDYTNPTINSNLKVQNIQGKVFFFIDSGNSQRLESRTEDFRIVNNISASEELLDVIYCDVGKNIMKLNGSQLYILPVGGLYNDYVYNNKNHYIYPRHLDYKLQKFFSIKPNNVVNGYSYRFETEDWFLKNNNMTYNIRFGEFESNNVTYRNYNNVIELTSRIHDNDLIDFYDTTNATTILDYFVASFEISKMSCIKYNSLKNGKLKYKTYNKEYEGNHINYSYYDVRQTDNVGILVGCDLKNDEKIKVSSSYNYKKDIDKDTYSFKTVASIMNMLYLFKLDYENPANHLYSVQLVDSYVKSGDFNTLNHWNFECGSYNISASTLHINNSSFRLYQPLYSYNSEQEMIADYKEGEELLLSFTISDYSSGILYVMINENTYTFNKNGTYSIKVIAPAEGINLVFSSSESDILSDIPVNLAISDITMISYNKVANNKFLSLDNWDNNEGIIIESNGVRLNYNKYVSQVLKLKEDKEYNCSIKVSLDNIYNTNLNILLDNETIYNIKKEGIYNFVFTGKEINQLKLHNIGERSCIIEYIEIVEKPYNNDEYLMTLSDGWNYKTNNIEIVDEQIHIKGGYSNSILSSVLKPNTHYNLKFDVNLYVGKLTVNIIKNVDDIIVRKTLKEITSSEIVNIDFDSMNVDGSVLEFVYSNSSKMFISNMKLEVKNYLIPLSSIDYNWQTVNDVDNTVEIKLNHMLLNHTPADVEIYQESPILDAGREYTIYLTGVVFTEGSSMKLYVGADDEEHCLTVTETGYQYTCIMGAGKYIKLKTVETTTASIGNIKLSIKADNIPLTEEIDVLNSNRNTSLTEIKLPDNLDLTIYEYYNNQKIGMKIGNCYATGYLNIEGKIIENVVRSKEFMKQDLSNTDIILDANNLIEILLPNYVFMDIDCNVYSTTKVEYSKNPDKISATCKIWYNMLKQNYYYRNNGNDFIVYLIGVAYTDESNVVFTENIQKSKKLLSYTKPVLKSNYLVKEKEGLYDTPFSLFLSGKRVLLDVSKPYGTYILYRKKSDASYQYNLDVNELYIDYEHINETPVWSTELKCFVSPYTLDEAISEFHHSENGLKIYSLTNDYDDIDVEERYERLTFKNPNNTVMVDWNEYTIDYLTSDAYVPPIGSKVYWKN